tara:strand:- start:45 stop:1892 length:1848 start_codon:yes stop_codon:yes gene_type:complete
MSDLTQVNANLNSLNEKQDQANQIAKTNVDSNNENNSVLQNLGEKIDTGDKTTAQVIGSRLSGLKDSVLGLFSGSQEEKNESRRSMKETIKFLGGKLGDLAKGIGGGFGAAKDKLSEVLAPALFFLKQIVIGGLIFLFFKKLPDILNSPLFGEILNTIQTIVIPALQKLYNNFIVPFAKNIGERLLNLFEDINDETKTTTDVLTENAGILSAAVGLLALKFFGVSGIMTGASAIMQGMMISAGLLKTAFIFIGGKLMLIGTSLMASIVPMAVAALPFIAIGAAVVGAIALVITAIQNIRDRFTEGQTFLERIKIIAQEIFLAPVRLFQNIIGFIAEKLGFEKFAEAVKGFNPLEFFSNMFSNIGNFLKEKFSLNDKTKEDLLKAFKFISDVILFIPRKIASFLKGIIPNKLKKFLGFGGDEEGEDTVTPPDADTSAQDTQGASVIEDQNEKKKKSFLQKSVFANIKDFISGKKEDKEQVPPLVEKIREDRKKQKQELMDATYGSANREEFAKQVAAGVLATQGSLSVDESKRAKFTSKDIEALQNAGINMSEIDNLALKNELLKAKAAAEGFNPSNNVSTNVIDNSNNSTTVQEEIILDPKITDFNFMTSAAADF